MSLVDLIIAMDAKYNKLYSSLDQHSAARVTSNDLCLYCPIPTTLLIKKNIYEKCYDDRLNYKSAVPKMCGRAVD